MNLIRSILHPLAVIALLTAGTLTAQTVTTTTGLANALTAANAAPSSSTTINLAAGTYNLTTALPTLAANNLTLQGPASGTPAIIDAAGLSSGIIFNVTADHVVIANITLRNARSHAIAIQPGADSGRIEDCVIDNPTAPPPATAAIDGNGCQNWAVTGNTISGIIGTAATAEPAIHFYGGASSTEITNNLIFKCDRAITLGAATITTVVPAITTQPASITVAAGQTATFTVVATGVPAPTYQWYKNSTVISGATSATYTIASAAVGDSGTYTVAVSNGTAPDAVSQNAVLTVNAPPSAGFVVSASRVKGVAPLAVSFDTTASPAFADGSYIDATCQWNFDADKINPQDKYPTGNGFVAAHVFEKPGTYRVLVKINALSGETSTETLSVTVDAFSGTSYYVASNGSDTNSGTTITAPLKTFNKAMTKAGPNVRILFRKGDTFHTPGYTDLSYKNGPLLITSYSDPAAPSSVNPVIFSDAVDSDWTTLNIGPDCRVFDMTFSSGGSTSKGPGEGVPGSHRYPGGVGFGGLASNSLIFRVKYQSLGSFCLIASGINNIQQECELNDIGNGGWSTDGGTYGLNDGSAIIGNWEHNVNPDNHQHAFRLQGGTRFYIAYNILDDQYANFDALTIRGNDDRVVIYKNTVMGMLSITPQNRSGTPEEHQHHVLVDSNLFIGRAEAGYNNGVAVMLNSAQYVVVRNNIIYNYTQGFSIEANSSWGNTGHVKILNNTMIGSDWEYFQGVIVAGVCQDINVLNNAFYDYSSASGYQRRFIQVTGANNLSGTSNNNAVYGVAWPTNHQAFVSDFGALSLSEWRARTGQDMDTVWGTIGLFQSISPSDPQFTAPSDTSILRGNGAAHWGVILDYYGNPRSSTPDIGAVQFQ